MRRYVQLLQIEKQTFAEQAENLQNWADAAIAWLFSVDMTFDTDDDSDGTSIPTPRSKEDRGDPLTGEDRYDDGGISDSGPNLTGVVTSGDGDGDSIGAWSGGMEGDDEGDDSVTAARRGKKKDDGHAVYIDTDAQSEREDGALACAAHARICEALSGADSDDDGRDWDVGGIIRPKSVVVGSGDADDGLEEMTDVWKFYTVAIANDDGASSMTSSDSIVDHSSISTCSDGDDGSWTAMAGATADTCESVAVAMANNDDDVMPSGSSRSSVDSSSRADTGSNSNSTAGRALSALVRTKEVGWARMLLGKRFRKPSWWRRKRRRSSRGHEFDAR